MTSWHPNDTSCYSLYSGAFLRKKGIPLRTSPAWWASVQLWSCMPQMPITSASPTAKGMKWLCIQYNNHTCSQWSLGSELSSIAAAVVIACWLCISIMIIHSIWACHKQPNVVWSYLRICLRKAWGTRLNPQNTGHHLLPQSPTAFFFGWDEASYCQYFLV